MRHHSDAAPYQATCLTSRTSAGLLADMAALDVTGARVSERGTAYLVFAPRGRRTYNATLAVTCTILLAIADLVATAASVVWIALLPLALVPFIPLLLDDRPQLAVGAVPADGQIGVTRVTVHGRVWGDLGAAVEAYMTHLPAVVPAGAGDPSDEEDDPRRDVRR
ncbi:MAG TPA: hypothetical protein VFO60_00680 [Candidatus Dormibacteraeota bacterium]|nr:hypothetical protein [Candidatus Dormibacteraeota bacterium]